MAYAPTAAGRLRTTLATLAPVVPGVFLYHPGRRQVLPKLRAFIDHIARLQSQGLFAPALLDERRPTRALEPHEHLPEALEGSSRTIGVPWRD